MQDVPYDTSHVPIDYDDSINVKEVRNKVSHFDERRERNDKRAALEVDVLQLQKELIAEEKLRDALYRELSRPVGSLPRIYDDMPVETRKILLEVALLEEEILSLENQVNRLGREIEIEGVPALDKETIWESTAGNPSPKKGEIIVSPLVSPKIFGRTNSRVAPSSRKSTEQKNNPLKPSLPAGKVSDTKRSTTKASVPAPRGSSDNGGSIEPSKSLKDSPEPTRVFSSVPPNKPQFQRSGSFPKAIPSNCREKRSRRLLFSQKDLSEPSGVMQTIPFIPIKNGASNEDEVIPQPESPSLLRPGRSYSRPSKIETGEPGVAPMVVNSRFGRRDLIDSKVAPATRTVKPRGTSRLAGPEVGSLPRSRIRRLPLASDTISTSRTMSSPTATSKRRIFPKNSASASNTSAPQMSCDLCLRKPADGNPDNNGKDGVDSASTKSETAGGFKPSHPSPDRAKSPPAAGSSSPSHVSISANIFSVIPGEGGGLFTNFKPDYRYTSRFIMMRSASTKYMRDCYSGEVADALTDPTIYMNTGNISRGTGFHQSLMS